MTSDNYGQAYEGGFALTVRFLRSRGLQREDAREAAQAAWARGWERVNQLRDDTLVLAWVNSIALNVHRGMLRRAPLSLSSTEVRDKAVAIDLTAIDAARVLAFCRPEDRVLLEQCLAGASMAEIGQQHGVSETAIRVRLFRVRRYVGGRILRRNSNPWKANPAATRRQAA